MSSKRREKRITDTMRLDWLGKQNWPTKVCAWSEGGPNPTVCYWRVELPNEDVPLCANDRSGKTPRQAIDAAIRAPEVKAEAGK